MWNNCVYWFYSLGILIGISPYDVFNGLQDVQISFLHQCLLSQAVFDYSVAAD